MASSSSTTSLQLPENVITIHQEKDFLLKSIFNGDVESFTSANTFCNLYDNSNDMLIPLTSVIYTPNKRFFEKSKFFMREINNKNTLNWLKKRNILVLVYGITSKLDFNFQSQEMYNDSRTLMDIVQGGGRPTTLYTSRPKALNNDDFDFTNTNEDMINLLRFENSPFNHRLNIINNRIKNVYSCNFTSINYLLFNDLNNENCINKFINNTININLN